MADDEIPDYEPDGALDWIYVEDDFPLAVSASVAISNRCKIPMERFLVA